MLSDLPEITEGLFIHIFLIPKLILLLRRTAKLQRGWSRICSNYCVERPYLIFLMVTLRDCTNKLHGRFRLSHAALVTLGSSSQ